MGWGIVPMPDSSPTTTNRRVWSLIRDPYWTPWLCSLVVLCLGVAWVLVAIYELVQIEVRHD
jgi:hypothetical protein